MWEQNVYGLPVPLLYTRPAPYDYVTGEETPIIGAVAKVGAMSMLVPLPAFEPSMLKFTTLVC